MSKTEIAVPPSLPAAPCRPGTPAAVPALPDAAAFSIVATTPPIPPHEVESTQRTTEVAVLWGESSVLQVDHLREGQHWFLGERSELLDENRKPGFLIGDDLLGAPERPLVLAERDATQVVIPPGATGTLTVAGEVGSIADARRRGGPRPFGDPPFSARPFDAWVGAFLMPLPRDATLCLQYLGFTFVIKSVHAGKQPAGPLRDALLPLATLSTYLLAVGLITALFLAILSLQPPSGMGLNTSLLEQDSRLVAFMLEPKETQRRPPVGLGFSHPSAGDLQGPVTTKPSGGAAPGGPSDSNTGALAAPTSGTHPCSDTSRCRKVISPPTHAGILGVLAQTLAPTPESPFGAGRVVPPDILGRIGVGLGLTTGFGPPGARPHGTSGGNGSLKLVGSGPVGSGINTACPPGAPCEHLPGLQRAIQRTTPRSPRAKIQTSGALSKEVIRRTIRRHVNEIRHCYERGLSARPDLAGRVTVSFVVAPSGQVQHASVVPALSSIGDSSVESCVAGAVRRWSFPQPSDGGVASIRYPFMFSPGT